MHSINYALVGLIILPLIPQYAQISKYPLFIEGDMKMMPLDDKIPISFTIKDGSPWAELFVHIYIDDVLIIDEVLLTPQLPNTIFYLPPISEKNYQFNVKLETNYVGNDVANTLINMTYSSPSYSNYSSSGGEFKVTSPYPTSIHFQAQGSKQNITQKFESVSVYGLNQLDLKKTRYVDFSSFRFSIESDKEFHYEFAIVKIYKKFPGSDLVYENNYTKIKVPILATSKNVFACQNDFAYYINESTGMIYESKNDFCDGELLPFFIPLSAGYNQTIPMEVIFSEIDYNHNSYIYKTNLVLGDKLFDFEHPTATVLKYHFIAKDSYFEGVKYE